MIHTLFMVVLWFLSLFLAYQLGQANQLMKMLGGRGAVTRSVEPELQGPPRSPSIYDGEAEAALDPSPLLTVLDGLEERPVLRVVEP